MILYQRTYQWVYYYSESHPLIITTDPAKSSVNQRGTLSHKMWYHLS